MWHVVRDETLIFGEEGFLAGSWGTLEHLPIIYRGFCAVPALPWFGVLLDSLRGSPERTGQDTTTDTDTTGRTPRTATTDHPLDGPKVI